MSGSPANLPFGQRNGGGLPPAGSGGGGTVASRPTNPYHVVLACFLGWTVDAFDFFILIFVVGDVAKTFGVGITDITWAITLTLALRVVGAAIFGWAADRWGRRPVLIANVLIFSVLGAASGLAPTLGIFLLFRALYGVAMGGEWGVGASLTMESVPAHWRGLVSGILQSGYSFGYLLAALLYGLFYESLGWRGMFVVTLIPALLVLYVRRVVPESPDWERRQRLARQPGTGAGLSMLGALRQHGRLVGYAILLMTAAAFFSHGTQDLYPVFLRVQHGLSVHEVATVAVIYNIGAILGCLAGGTLSQLWGRRRQLMIATICAVVLVFFWSTASGVVTLAATAFLMQFLVQCTFGVVPAHLNEISPPEIRGTFPGFVYQFGNMLAAANATIQSALADSFGGNYGLALGITVGIGAVVFCLMAAIGREARHVEMSGGPDAAPPGAEPDETGRAGPHGVMARAS
ncbi:MFS transporter [Roseomonas elaeocarpi]|uniref:MFS transporter n=1 Tax=Roseomonas elaeocarpi TaxID=907779 RepID=A0ABV6JNV7_9PROT